MYLLSTSVTVPLHVITKNVFRIYCIFSTTAYGGIIAAGEITAILSIPGEKQPTNITKFFFDALLQFMVSEVGEYSRVLLIQPFS